MAGAGPGMAVPAPTWRVLAQPRSVGASPWPPRRDAPLASAPAAPWRRGRCGRWQGQLQRCRACGAGTAERSWWDHDDGGVRHGRLQTRLPAGYGRVRARHAGLRRLYLPVLHSRAASRLKQHSIPCHKAAGAGEGPRHWWVHSSQQVGMRASCSQAPGTAQRGGCVRPPNVVSVRRDPRALVGGVKPAGVWSKKRAATVATRGSSMRMRCGCAARPRRVRALLLPAAPPGCGASSGRPSLTRRWA